MIIDGDIHISPHPGTDRISADGSGSATVSGR
jgi:hypothetical protein